MSASMRRRLARKGRYRMSDREYDLYDDEVRLTKEQFLEAGNSMELWRKMEITSKATLLSVGFRSGFEVRRVVNRCGRRV